MRVEYLCIYFSVVFAGGWLLAGVPVISYNRIDILLTN